MTRAALVLLALLSPAYATKPGGEPHQSHQHCWHVESTNHRDCVEHVLCCWCGGRTDAQLPGCKRHGPAIRFRLEFPDGGVW